MDEEERLKTALAERYTIEGRIGSGGMATVYLAHDLRHDRRVAVKVLDRELAQSLGAERFLREIRTAANLTHPHVLPVHDSGEADGCLYYVMPYVRGESLRTLIEKEKQLPVEDAVRIAREMAGALAYAHSEGIVHRDVKPSNIMLEAGHAVLTDFGVAYAVAEAGGERITRAGSAMGTPAYMSPEQATGEHSLDGRSDVYSLGCVLYEMLAGDPPFTGSTPAAVLARQVQGRVPSLRVVRPNLPPALAKVVEKALEKVPADRYQTAAEFGSALGGALTGEVTRDRPAIRVGPGHMALVALGAAVLLGVYSVKSCGGEGGFGTDGTLGGRSTSTTPLKRIAVTFFPVHSDDPALEPLGDALTDLVTDGLFQLGTLTVLPVTAMRPFKGAGLPAEAIAELGIDAYVEGSVMGTSDQVSVSVQLIDAHDQSYIASDVVRGSAGAPFSIVEDLAGEISGLLRDWLGVRIEAVQLRTGTKSEAAWNLVQLGSKKWEDGLELDRSGDTAAAGRLLAEADELLARAEAEDRSYITPIIDRGWVAADRALLVTSQAQFDTTWARVGSGHAERALKKDPNHPGALELRGVLLDYLASETKDAARADSLLGEAEVDLRRATELDDSRSRAHTRLSRIYYNQGRLAEAKLEALKAYEADPYQRDAPTVLYWLCSSSLELQLWTEVTRWCDEGRRRFPDRPSFPSAQLAALSGPRGPEADPQLAWQLMEKVVSLSEPQLRGRREPNHRMQVAAVLARAGLADSARAVMNRALAMPEAIGPDLDVQEANACLQLGDVGRTLDLLERYLEARPARRAEMAKDWWWEKIWDHPRFKALVDTAGGGLSPN